MKLICRHCHQQLLENKANEKQLLQKLYEKGQSEAAVGEEGQAEATVGEYRQSETLRMEMAAAPCRTGGHSHPAGQRENKGG